MCCANQFPEEAIINEKGVGTYCLYPFSEASRIAFVAG